MGVVHPLRGRAGIHEGRPVRAVAPGMLGRLARHTHRLSRRHVACAGTEGRRWPSA
ncbi:hypothetical protein STXM2123_2210 [Streptomyces sp. F-3]|nr:hypothetical protein STXM2123_2210 [Streptomyces sp. F-3]